MSEVMLNGVEDLGVALPLVAVSTSVPRENRCGAVSHLDSMGLRVKNSVSASGNVCYTSDVQRFKNLHK